MKRFFLVASGLFALVPGLTIMSRGIATPPGYETLFGGIVEAFGALSLVTLWTNRNRLKRLSKRRTTRSAVALGVACFLFLCIYLSLFTFCVVAHPKHGIAYFPLWSAGHLAELINSGGSRYGALDRYGLGTVDKAIEGMPGHAGAMLVTTTLLLLLYQGIFTSLTTAFGMVGFHEGESLFTGD